MSNNYKFKRDWENAEKAIYDGEGEFDIPVIMPEEYHSVEWIGFNKARVTQNRENKGVHFFLDDYQFVRLWKNIDRYVDLLKSYDFVMSPDFSTYTNFPKAMQIYNHYRKHWIGAYLQEHGVRVIPTISWSTLDSFEWCFDGEPQNSTVAISSVGCSKTIDKFITGYDAMMERLHPSIIIFYGNIPAECKGNIVHISSFTEKWREAKMLGW